MRPALASFAVVSWSLLLLFSCAPREYWRARRRVPMNAGGGLVPARDGPRGALGVLGPAKDGFL